MSVKLNIAEMRKHLFAQLEVLGDMNKTPDIPRARAISEIAMVLVASAKVEVEFHRVMQGAIALPFIESQEEVLPADTPPSEKPRTAMENTAMVLVSKNENHPWRGPGFKRPARG